MAVNYLLVQEGWNTVSLQSHLTRFKEVNISIFSPYLSPSALAPASYWQLQINLEIAQIRFLKDIPDSVLQRHQSHVELKLFCFQRK
jgi:hypothetical protein